MLSYFSVLVNRSHLFHPFTIKKGIDPSSFIYLNKVQIIVSLASGILSGGVTTFAVSSNVKKGFALSLLAATATLYAITYLFKYRENKKAIQPQKDELAKLIEAALAQKSDLSDLAINSQREQEEKQQEEIQQEEREEENRLLISLPDHVSQDDGVETNQIKAAVESENAREQEHVVQHCDRALPNNDMEDNKVILPIPDEEEIVKRDDDSLSSETVEVLDSENFEEKDEKSDTSTPLNSEKILALPPADLKDQSINQEITEIELETKENRFAKNHSEKASIDLQMLGQLLEKDVYKYEENFLKKFKELLQIFDTLKTEYSDDQFINQFHASLSESFVHLQCFYDILMKNREQFSASSLDQISALLELYNSKEGKSYFQKLSDFLLLPLLNQIHYTEFLEKCQKSKVSRVLESDCNPIILVQKLTRLEGVMGDIKKLYKKSDRVRDKKLIEQILIYLKKLVDDTNEKKRNLEQKEFIRLQKELLDKEIALLTNSSDEEKSTHCKKAIELFVCNQFYIQAEYEQLNAQFKNSYSVYYTAIWQDLFKKIEELRLKLKKAKFLNKNKLENDLKKAKTELERHQEFGDTCVDLKGFQQWKAIADAILSEDKTIAHQALLDPEKFLDKPLIDCLITSLKLLFLSPRQNSLSSEEISAFEKLIVQIDEKINAKNQHPKEKTRNQMDLLKKDQHPEEKTRKQMDLLNRFGKIQRKLLTLAH